MSVIKEDNANRWTVRENTDGEDELGAVLCQIDKTEDDELSINVSARPLSSEVVSEITDAIQQAQDWNPSESDESESK